LKNKKGREGSLHGLLFQPWAPVRSAHGPSPYVGVSLGDGGQTPAKPIIPKIKVIILCGRKGLAHHHLLNSEGHRYHIKKELSRGKFIPKSAIDL